MQLLVMSDWKEDYEGDTLEHLGNQKERKASGLKGTAQRLSSSNDAGIVTVTSKDILCGRGNESFSHGKSGIFLLVRRFNKLARLIVCYIGILQSRQRKI